MCGIYGWITPGRPVDAPACAAALSSLQHRGPDGFGVATGRLGDRRLRFSRTAPDLTVEDSDVYLGHRRLAVIDLTDSALQPMCNETGDLWVVFNGEIYNHAALRAQLESDGHRFHTDHADTEVLVHGFEQWGGSGLLQRVRGMFAFAMLDLRRRELFLARDPFGEKPLYVSHSGEGVVFASELRAILKHPLLAPKVSMSALADYLRFGYVPAPSSIIQNVWKLRAAESATFALEDTSTCGKSEYWRVSDYSPATTSVDV